LSLIRRHQPRERLEERRLAARVVSGDAQPVAAPNVDVEAAE
jgi:hypothetical protein